METRNLKEWIYKNVFKEDNTTPNPQKLRSYKWIKKNHKDIFDSIHEQTNFLPKESKISQRIWHIINNIYHIPNCETCKNNLSYKGINKGYGKYCSKKCTNIMRNKKLHKKYENWSIIREKAEKTCLKKYGNEFYNNRDKTKETNLKKYGVDNPLQSDIIKKKVQDTCLKKYDTPFPLLNKKIKEKALNTLKEKYNIKENVSNPFEIEEIKEKIKKTNLKKYGVEYNSQKNLKNTKDLNKKFVIENFIDKDENYFKLDEFQNYYNMSYSYSYLKLKELGIQYNKKYSCSEKELCDFLKRLTNEKIVKNSRKIIYPQEIDIFIPSFNIAIEYNGLYWHSEVVNKDKNYHKKKTESCEEKGIQLLHIFEHKWKNEITRDIIKSMISNKIKSSKKIYARKCKIKEVNNYEKNMFLNENHIQGQCQSSINIGLYYDENLISLMTFGKSRFNKNYEWELLRFCNKKYHSVVGGASKLLKNFINTYNEKNGNIVTYADMTYSNGNLYEKLGFKKISINKPTYHYFKNDKILNRLQTQKKNLNKLIDNFDPNLTEWQNMYNNGYNRFWDCGNIVYEYK